MSFIRNVSITFATKLVLAVVGLVTSIVVARTLGPAGKGLYSLVILSAAIVFRLAHMGIGTGTGYFLGRRNVPYEALAGNWLSLSVLIGACVLALSLAVAPYLTPHLLPSVPLSLVMGALLSVPFAVITSNFSQLFSANNDFVRFNLLELVQPVVFLLLFSVLLAVVAGRGIENAVLAFIVSSAAAAVLALGMTDRLVRLRFRWSRELVRAAVSFGIQGHLAGIVKFLNLRLDLLLVNLFLAPVHVGYYSISVMVAEKIWYIPDVLSIVLYPRVAHGTDEDANRYTSIVGRQTIMIVCMGCAVIALFGGPLVSLLYSERFLPAVTPLLVLLPGIISASIARVLSSDLMARGYPRVVLLAGFVALLANIGLNILLIPRMGVSGAALASSVSYALNALVVLTAFLRISGLRAAAVLVPRGSDFRLLRDGLRTALRRDREGRW